MLLGAPSRRQQIHKESEDIEGKDERDDPFENGGYVLSAVERRHGKDYCKDHLHDDEYEFQPKGEAQDPVLAEMHAEALVFGAYKDRTDDVARDKEEKEAIM